MALLIHHPLKICSMLTCPFKMKAQRFWILAVLLNVVTSAAHIAAQAAAAPDTVGPSMVAIQAANASPRPLRSRTKIFSGSAPSGPFTPGHWNPVVPELNPPPSNPRQCCSATPFISPRRLTRSSHSTHSPEHNAGPTILRFPSTNSTREASSPPVASRFGKIALPRPFPRM